MAPGGTVLGLDEAGRGSLVGPLVLGGFLTREETLSRLPEIGVADSKLLAPGAREQVFRLLPSVGRRYAIEVPPSTVDRYVRRGRLNRLEAECFAQIVRRARPTTVFVDACDPVAERFGRHIHGLSGSICMVHASHRADAEIPVVGAASIVAKVRRDRAVGRLHRELGQDFGSGYPSDERTVTFVREALQRASHDPSWLRSSWATTERLKREFPAVTLDQFPP
jgi:ribonuclease HII